MIFTSFLVKNGNPVYEAQPGGAPSNLLAAASRLGQKQDLWEWWEKILLGDFLCTVTKKYGIDDKGLLADRTGANSRYSCSV